jgi:hypothetical protein
MKIFALVLFCLLAPGLSLAGRSDVDRKLASMRAGIFDVKDVPAREAFDKLAAMLAALGDGAYKIRIIPEPEKIAGFKRQILPKVKAKKLQLDRPVTLRVTDTPILFLAKALAADIDGVVAVRGREILVYPDHGTFDDLVTQAFALNPAKAAGRFADFQSQLAEGNIKIYEGGYAKYSEKSGKLIVRTTQDQIALICFIVD